MTTNKQLKAHCEDVIANPQDHLDWVVDMAKEALTALTQPASPALKLPDPFSPHDAKMFCTAHGVTGAYELASKMANYAVDKVVRLNAPHTAQTEPICATGGAEWMKVSDVEIEQELISLQSGNGQLRGDSFYREALKELRTLRNAFSEPYGWITEYPSIPAGIGGMTYSFHDNRQDAQDEAEAYDGFAVAVIRKP